MKITDIKPSENVDDFLNYTMSILCNSAPQSHCSQADWDVIIKFWLNEYNTRYLNLCPPKNVRSSASV